MTHSEEWDGGLNPPDDAWIPNAKRVTDVVLDAGFELPGTCPNWLLPHPGAVPPPILPPSLPNTYGYVLSAEASRDPEALVCYYRQFPSISEQDRRGDRAWFNNVSVNLLLFPDKQHPIVIDTFGPGIADADPILQHLADLSAPDGEVYDNLDQGWALRVLLRGPDVLLLDWNWDNPSTSDPPRCIRIARALLAPQAAAARHRMLALQATLVAAVGTDLWQSGRPSQPPPPRRRGWIATILGRR